MLTSLARTSAAEGSHCILLLSAGFGEQSSQMNESLQDGHASSESIPDSEWEHVQDQATLPKSPGHLHFPNSSESSISGETLSEHLSIRLGRPMRSFSIATPAIFAGLVAAGMATGLLLYLLAHRISEHDSIEDPSFRGALVAYEPKSRDDVRQNWDVFVFGAGQNATAASLETTLYGLTLSSVAVHLISWSTPLIVGVFAYLIANMWMHNQNIGRHRELPTSQQYGLLLGLLANSGIVTLWDAIAYLCFKSRHTPTPKILYLSTLGVFSIITINIGLAAADLWLHTTSGTFIHNFESVTHNALVLLPTNASVSCPPVQVTVPGSNDVRYCGAEVQKDPHSVNSGTRLAGNIRTRNPVVKGIFQIQTLANLSVLLPAAPPPGLKFNFTSYATGVSCEPVTGCSQIHNSDSSESSCGGSLFSCPAFTPPLILSPPNGSSLNSSFKSVPDGVVSSSVAQYNLSDGHPLFYPNFESISGGYPLGSSINPSGVQLVFALNSSLQYPAFGVLSPENDDPGWYYSCDGNHYYYYYVGACNFSVYDVRLSYDGTSQAHKFGLLEEPVLSNFNSSTALFAPFDPSFSPTLAGILLEGIQGFLGGNPTLLQQALETNLSTNALTYGSYVLGQESEQVNGTAVAPASVGHYPLAPLCTLLVLLYAYALAAFVLAGFVARSSSREVVVDDGKPALIQSETSSLRKCKTGGRTASSNARVSQVLLAHARLTSLRAVLADRFDERTADEVLPGLQARTFDADEGAEEPARIGVGAVAVGGGASEDDHLKEGGLRKRSLRIKADRVDRLVT